MRISLNLPSPLLASIPESMNIRRQTSDFSVFMSAWALGRGKSFGKQMFVLFCYLKPIHQFTLDGQVLPKELLGNNGRKYRLGEWHRQRKGLWWEDVSMTVLGKRMWRTAQCCRPQVSASLFCVLPSQQHTKSVRAMFRPSSSRALPEQCIHREISGIPSLVNCPWVTLSALILLCGQRTHSWRQSSFSLGLYRTQLYEALLKKSSLSRLAGHANMHLYKQWHIEWEGKTWGSKGMRYTSHHLVLTGCLRQTDILGSPPDLAWDLHLTLENALHMPMSSPVRWRKQHSAAHCKDDSHHNQTQKNKVGGYLFLSETRDCGQPAHTFSTFHPEDFATELIFSSKVSQPWSMVEASLEVTGEKGSLLRL